MTDRPIIFSAPMVRALWDGRKTQTRRVLKPLPRRTIFFDPKTAGLDQFQDPPYAPGDRLYVREAHSLHGTHGQNRDDGKRWGPWGGLPTTISPDGTKIAYYREGFDRCDPGRWRPSIHMPRWASRLTLTVTEVRVQRLQEISTDDAIAEGVSLPYVPGGTLAIMAQGIAKDAYRTLWNSLHGPDAWASNPWIVALTFTVARQNIDAEGGEC